jgi:hypothetical protein
MSLSEIAGGIMTTVHETTDYTILGIPPRALGKMCPLMEGR